MPFLFHIIFACLIRCSLLLHSVSQIPHRSNCRFFFGDRTGDFEHVESWVGSAPAEDVEETGLFLMEGSGSDGFNPAAV